MSPDHCERNKESPCCCILPLFERNKHVRTDARNACTLHPHNSLPHNSLAHNSLPHNSLSHNSLPHNSH
eukprot:1812207-Rhodomonas_salina.2